MRFAYVTVLLAGCSLYFDGGNADDDPCLTDVAPPAYTERLVNPDTLACQGFSQPTCDDTCGPCPLAGAGQIYIPAWGRCDSTCLGLDEATCEKRTDCRVARQGALYFANQPDSFMGCYPTGTLGGGTSGSCTGLDAESCSNLNFCASVYEGNPDNCGGAANFEACNGARFVQCVPEAAHLAGTCAPAACRVIPPSCPYDTTPGVENGCYTGACLPNQYCAVAVN